MTDYDPNTGRPDVRGNPRAYRSVLWVSSIVVAFFVVALLVYSFRDNRNDRTYSTGDQNRPNQSDNSSVDENTETDRDAH